MAHFAELDDNNVVLRVIVVADRDCLNDNGDESEAVGAAFCANTFGGRWVQTSYNGNFRKCYAGIGSTYLEDVDAFKPAPPSDFPSWVWNETEWRYEPPVAEPTVDRDLYRWDEATVTWVLKTNPPPQ